MKVDIKDRIADYHKRRALISVHVIDQRVRNFYAGYVQKVDDDDFLLTYVDPGGLPGKPPSAWIQFDEVDWINVGTPYLIGLEQLAKVASRHKGLKNARWKSAKKSIRRTLQECCAARMVCRIRDHEDDADYVLVRQVGEDYADLLIIGDDGSAAGEFVMRLTEIEGVRAGGLSEVARTYLYNRSRKARP